MKRFLKWFAILFPIALVITWFCLPYYMQRALVYTAPNIDDYKIFENRVVKAGTPVPWQLDERYNRTPISDSLKKPFEDYQTVAFLVAQNNQLLHEEYWDDYGKNSRSNSFSMSKSIVSLCIGILLDEGKIQSVDQKITEFIPELKGCNQVSIQDLLTMSSGLSWDESYSSLFSITTKGYYGNNLTQLVTGLTPIEPNGTVYQYRSGDTQLLSILIERVSGKTLSDFVSEKLWKPLGCENDALWSLDTKNGIEKAYCCFNSNARDFARLGQLVLDSGFYAGKQLVSKEYIRQATSPATWLRDDKGDTNTYYGYQFWILDYKNLRIPCFRGILGQYIFVIPDKNAVVVRLGKKRSDVYKGNYPVDVFVWLDAALDLLDKPPL